MKRIILFCIMFFFAVGSIQSQNTVPIKLFNPDEKNEWYVFIEGAGKGKDSAKVFSFEDDMIHASGEKFGYIATEESYTNFYLILEFKWGEKKYPPRLNDKRDAGILYNGNTLTGDKIWPRSIECQIEEGDCGDIWLIDSASVIHTDTISGKPPYQRIIKFLNAERPTGEWNKVEVIVNNNDITYLVNGQVVNKARNPNPNSGRIMLQSEGAEIYYRNVLLRKI